jgi:hypothetical protein
MLPRFSACTISDARSGVTQFFQSGKVRAKKAGDGGGHGQSVIADANELKAFLNLLDDKELRREGMVLEANLNNMATSSFGQTLGKSVDDLLRHTATDRQQSR